MRQRHFAGEKLFIDYAGRTLPIYGYGDVVAFDAHLFITAMGASGYAYAEATRSDALPDWLGSHVRAFEYYGCVPTILVYDFVTRNKISHSAAWHAIEEGERASVRIEHHLLALARIGHQEKPAAVT
jgi:transposase